MKSIAKKLSYAALFAALCLVGTLLVTVPLPNGYFNVGDVFVLLAAWCLGGLWGGVAAAIGSALADLWSGFALYAPATFLVKGLDAFAAFGVVWLVKKVMPAQKLDFIARLLGALCGELIMVFGYFLFESVLYGFATAALSLAGNALQGACCGGLAVAIFSALYPIPSVRKLFPALYENKKNPD